MSRTHHTLRLLLLIGMWISAAVLVWNVIPALRDAVTKTATDAAEKHKAAIRIPSIPRAPFTTALKKG